MLFSIYLPGYSNENQEDLEAISRKFRKKEVPHYARHWDHWYEGGLPFDLERELDQLTTIMKTLKNPDYALIGKSIGSLVAVNLITKLPKSPKLIVLMGVPLSMLKPEDLEQYKSALKNPDYRKVIVQNAGDPYGGEKELQSMLGDVIKQNSVDVMIPEGKDHKYNYPEMLIDLISEVED
jgi:hypothetical protein